MPYNENYKWDFEGIFTKEQLPQVFELFDHEEFYSDEFIEVFPNATEIINELSEKYRIIFVSKHKQSRKHLTRAWIYKTFPNTELVFLDSFNKSCVAKNIFRDECLLILDDRLDALDSMDGLVKYQVCYNLYDWNVEWEGLRVNNWLEFKQFVENLVKVDEQ